MSTYLAQLGWGVKQRQIAQASLAVCTLGKDEEAAAIVPATVPGPALINCCLALSCHVNGALFEPPHLFNNGTQRKWTA